MDATDTSHDHSGGPSQQNTRGGVAGRLLLPSAHPMKQVIVGTYQMGFESVELVLREDTGGEFYATPALGKVARIKVGADHRYWNTVVAVLLHEAFELAMDRMRCRLAPSNAVSKDLGDYTFILSHVEFSECCARVGEFVTAALPSLSTAWKVWKKAEK